MAMGTARSSSKPLHNFTLPYLKWGHQRHLRCMKVEDSSPSSPSVDHRPRRRSREFEFDDSGRHKGKVLLKSNGVDGGAEEEEGIDAVREKIMNDLKTAADKMKDQILREEVYEEEIMEDTHVAAAAVEAAEVRPWNLRTRRAACKAPNKGFRIEEKKPNSSPVNTEIGAKSPKLQRGEKEIKKERPKFAVSLMRKEIEEDFMEMVGHRPPRRPKKRPRIVQKQMDSLFPGLWLTEVTVDSYKVPELADNGKFFQHLLNVLNLKLKVIFFFLRRGSDEEFQGFCSLTTGCSAISAATSKVLLSVLLEASKLSGFACEILETSQEPVIHFFGK
ncbi:hypothetical protein WN944_011660 [Citrus x changshan-huyou]|uniref:Uncharacterized protein n=1 Tax=Citrus x changshan-huyou TaxID=2935761 RepID=A0AAP0MYP4_9ROSI